MRLTRRRVVMVAAALATASVTIASGCTSTTGTATPVPPRPSGTANVSVPRAPTLAGDLERTPVLETLDIPDLASLREGRRFTTSFDDPADLAGFYVTPQSEITHHEVSTERAHSGAAAHKAWLTGAGGPGLEVDGPNHRGYPTIQLHRLPGDTGFSSPTLTDLWVWADVDLARGQWFSFETFTNDASSRWTRVVTVNLDQNGYVNIFHAPRHGENALALQRTDVPMPMRTWVRLTTYLDLRPDRGAIAVWQDGTLIAASRVDPVVDPGVAAYNDAREREPSLVSDRLEQAHFGLYAPPELATATVFNDDLTIVELVEP